VWCSEAFVMVEFSTIPATYIRAKALTQAQGIRLLTEAQTLISTLHNIAHMQTLETEIEYEIPAYNARFISLAKHLKQKLVTEDMKLRAAVPSWTFSLADASA
jgi:predicted nucleic acid-binding protein